MMRRIRRTILITLTLLAVLQLYAQKGKTSRQSAGASSPESSKDSVFRLVKADEAQQLTEEGVEFRRIKGNAKFFHNNTTLLCDSASWNLDINVIDAYGHVKILQNGTTITSEFLTYQVDENLASFNGELVQLKDKDGNILRTQHLDYNTKDSLAIFENGAAMKSKDGNVIESDNGDYDAKTKVFVFQNNVKLYMDSIFLKTDRLDYVSDSSLAIFGPNTNVWKDNGYIRSNAGWYSRRDSTVCFEDRVYGHDPKYEFWADEMYYYKGSATVEMMDNVSLLDTANKVALVGNYLRHERDSSNTYLLNEPAVIYYGSKNNDGKIDTLFMRADTLIFQGRHKYDFTSDELALAQKRRADIEFDALTEYRTKAAAERQKKIEEGLRAAGKLPPLPKDSTATADSSQVQFQKPSGLKGAVNPADDGGDGNDSDKEPAVDTLQNVPQTAAVQDSTPVNIIKALHNFKMYREDMQAASDSLTFTDMDSIAVMLGRPIMWNTGKNQLTGEMMHLLIKNGNVDKGSMIEDARITSKEAENCFNQIKSTEMMGFFHDNELYRYDALGNVNAIIYMDEDGELTNINVKQSKSLTSIIKKGKAQRMLYLEEIKSDAYPIPDLEEDKRKLKGFEWRIEERPPCRDSITDRTLPKSWRKVFPGTKKPNYAFTDRYFDNYMTDLYESIRKKEEAERQRRIMEEAIRKADSYADSLFHADISQLSDSLHIADSIYFADSLKVDLPEKKKTDLSKADSTKEVKKMTAKERRELRRAERKARREARRAERKARREARKAARKAAREAKYTKKDTSSLPQAQPQN